MRAKLAERRMSMLCPFSLVFLLVLLLGARAFGLARDEDGGGDAERERERFGDEDADEALDPALALLFGVRERALLAALGEMDPAEDERDRLLGAGVPWRRALAALRAGIFSSCLWKLFPWFRQSWGSP